MLTLNTKTRPVWARLMILTATVLIASALVIAFAPDGSPSNAQAATTSSPEAQR